MAGKALYDVFLNFSGAYRNEIVDVLCEEIKSHSINVFIDRDGLREGDPIGETLLEVIPAMDIYIPVFTQEYASKKWCLVELEHMVEEWRSNRQKTILPIFYDVVPDDVQLNTSVYKDHLKEKEQEYGQKQVNKWRQALEAAAKIKGFVFDKNRDRFTEFAERVAGRVLSLLKQKVSKVLIGIDDRIEEVNSLLDKEAADVRYLVIHGVPGVGKTTLAKAVFDRLSSQFEGSSFLEDIRESLECHDPEDPAKFLESQLLIDIPGDDTGRSVRTRYRDKQVLIVFDDVKTWGQIKKLVESSVWFGSGSLIIITTEDDEIEYMLKLGKKSCASLKMSPMEEEEAIELFSWHAFRRREPPNGNFFELSREAVIVVGELPLGIKLLGSLLYREDETKWKKTLEEINSSDEDVINAILEMSFNKLKDGEKEIFLDTACFFVGSALTNPAYMWKACFLEGPNVLLERSLITQVDGSTLWMHRLLKEFGRNKVISENVQDPIHRSRLWSHDEASDVLKSKRRKKNAKAICQTRGKQSSACENTLAIRECIGLNKLRFLQVHRAKFGENLKDCLQELKWLSAHHCPEIPTDLQPRRLAILDLSRSGHVKVRWAGWEQMKALRGLKVLDLTGCESLQKTPSFPKNGSMERLILEDCKMLDEIDRSIGGLRHLMHLNVRGCDSLTELPDELCSASALREILISKKNHGPFTIPNKIGSLKSLVTLEIENVELSEIPGTISSLKKLKRLSLTGCSGLNCLPDSIGGLSSLTELDISNSKFVELPVTIGNATELRVMKMGSSPIRTLPKGIESLKNLEEIHAKGSELVGEVPKEIGDLSTLKILDFSFTKISRIPNEICRLSSLEKLDLESCDQISHVPSLPASLITLCISHTTHRMVEDLSSSSQSTNSAANGSGNDGSSDETQRRTNGKWIENLTKLKELKLGLPSTVALPSSFTQFDQLNTLDLYCQNTDSIPQLPSSLSVLSLGHCEVTKRTISNLNNLSILHLYYCQVDELGVSGLEKLVHVSAVKCTFSEDICRSLQTSLRILYISGGSFPKGVLKLSKLVNLKLLEVWDCNDLRHIQGLEDLKHVEELVLSGCSSISRLEGLSEWKSLQVFEVWDCENLEHIDGKRDLEDLCKRFRIVNCKNPDIKTLNDGLGNHPLPVRHRQIGFDFLHPFFPRAV